MEKLICNGKTYHFFLFEVVTFHIEIMHFTQWNISHTNCVRSLAAIICLMCNWQSSTVTLAYFMDIDFPRKKKGNSFWITSTRAFNRKFMFCTAKLKSIIPSGLCLHYYHIIYKRWRNCAFHYYIRNITLFHLTANTRHCTLISIAYSWQTVFGLFSMHFKLTFRVYQLMN